MDMELVIALAKGAAMGFVTVLVGWAKKQEMDKLDWRGFLLRVPMGMVVGAIAAWKGIPFDDAYQWAAGMGIIMLVDNITKFAYYRFGLEKRFGIRKKMGLDKVKTDTSTSQSETSFTEQDEKEDK